MAVGNYTQLLGVAPSFESEQPSFKTMEKGLVKGGKGYFFRPVWLGVQPSQDLVRAFQAGYHEQYLAGLGAALVDNADEQLRRRCADICFEAPELWQPEGQITSSQVFRAHHGLRFIVTDLPLPLGRLAVELCPRLVVSTRDNDRDPFEKLGDELRVRVLEYFAALPGGQTAGRGVKVDRTVLRKFIRLLDFVASSPESCDGYAMFTGEPHVVLAFRQGFSPREDYFESLLTTHIEPKPEEEMQEKSLSRNVCFWCMVSPMQRKLKVCGGCRFVAYCSKECQTLDWLGMHFDECKRTQLTKDADGQERFPASALQVSRLHTELSKSQRRCIRLIEDAKVLGVSIERRVLLSQKNKVIPVKNGFICKLVED